MSDPGKFENDPYRRKENPSWRPLRQHPMPEPPPERSGDDK